MPNSRDPASQTIDKTVDQAAREFNLTVSACLSVSWSFASDCFPQNSSLLRLSLSPAKGLGSRRPHGLRHCQLDPTGSRAETPLVRLRPREKDHSSESVWYPDRPPPLHLKPLPYTEWKSLCRRPVKPNSVHGPASKALMTRPLKVRVTDHRS